LDRRLNFSKNKGGIWMISKIRGIYDNLFGYLEDKRSDFS